MAKAGRSRGEVEGVLAENGREGRGRGFGRGRGRGRSDSDDQYSAGEEYLDGGDSVDEEHAIGAHEDRSAEFFEGDDATEEWQRAARYPGRREVARARLSPSSSRRSTSPDYQRVNHRDSDGPSRGYDADHRCQRRGRGYRDDFEGNIGGSSSQDRLERQALEEVPYRTSDRERNRSRGDVGTTGRATLPGAFASTEDPNAKSQIKEQIQTELQQFERTLRANRGAGHAGSGSSGRAPDRRGGRQDDSSYGEEQARYGSRNLRGTPSSRRGGGGRLAQYIGRGGTGVGSDDDSYYDDASIHSGSSLNRQTSRGSTTADRRTSMERTGSGRNILSRNVARERDRERGSLQRHGSGDIDRLYYEGDARDRGPRYDRRYGHQEYDRGYDDGLGGARGGGGSGGYGSSNLSRRELESRLALSHRSSERGSGGGGGGYHRGGCRDRLDRTNDFRGRSHGDGSNHSRDSYLSADGDSYHRRDPSPHQSYAQPFARRPNDYRNSHARSYSSTDRRIQQQQHHRQQPPPPQEQQQPRTQPVELELSPGVWMRLRGADETWNAVMTGAYCPTKCVTCALNLLCVLDAEYVLCPECRVVGPVGDDEFGMRAELLGKDAKPHGVGLGFKPEDLMRWQAEFARGIDPRESGFFANAAGY